MKTYAYLADVVVFLHAVYIGFVIFGLVAILLGAALGWRWVRNFWFRAVHLVMIGVVVVQAVLDITCPLTTLENQLRLKAGQAAYAGSFIGHYLHELIFWEGPPWAFVTGYCLFGAVVVAALLLVPPNRPQRRKRQ